MKYLHASLVALFCTAVGQLSAAERPNILFLLSDDHSYPFVSAYGDTNVKTPTLDRLGAEGMKFHRFFTACPQCVPSRAAYMTGRSAVAARMTRFTSPLPRDEITFPEILREKGGYFTGICGRPVYELYDLQADPSELNNLSGKPELASSERELRIALAEKMILDFDYLPLPALTPDSGNAPREPSSAGKARRRDGAKKKKAGERP